jgi:hypothetical protein
MHEAVRRASGHEGPGYAERQAVDLAGHEQRAAHHVEQHRQLEQVHVVAVGQRHMGRHARRLAEREVIDRHLPRERRPEPAQRHQTEHSEGERRQSDHR